MIRKSIIDILILFCSSLIISLFLLGTLNNCDGSAFVTRGSTSVITGIKAVLGSKPTIDLEPNNRLVINVNLSALSPPGRSSAKLDELAEAYSARIIQTFNKNGPIIAKEQFQFDSEGKLDWYLECDISVLNDDGSVYDAMMLSLVGALYNVKLRKGSFDLNGKPTISPNAEKFPLTLLQFPISSTFLLFEEYAFLFYLLLKVMLLLIQLKTKKILLEVVLLLS